MRRLRTRRAALIASLAAAVAAASVLAAVGGAARTAACWLQPEGAIAASPAERARLVAGGDVQ